MENKENLVLDSAENVEQTTEETPKAKMYTPEEVDAIVGKKIARTKAKIQKEHDRKYGELEDVLKAGMGKEDIGEITSDLRKFYTERKGINIPEKPKYSAKDIETLAQADADEIIRMGYDEVVEEVDRLAGLGVDKMSARDKALFKVLAEHRQDAERNSEFAKIGVTEDVYNSQEFKDFQGMFVKGTPIADIVNLYNKTHNNKEVRTMGSMKSTASEDNGVKDYYSHEEASKFTKEDFDKNPALYNAVLKSMQKWK